MSGEQKELRVRFDKTEQTLVVSEVDGGGGAPLREQPLFKQRLSAELAQNLQSVESTLGQLILWALNRGTPGGLGIGNYEEVFEKICEENLEAFSSGTDLTTLDGQYGLAVVMFAHGQRGGSWPQIERAIKLFENAAAGGHEKATHFLREDLPVVRDRLERKFKKAP